MPILRILRHGCTAGHAPMKNSHPRALRGAVEGWSDGATRRNTGFLRTVRESELHGHGYAVTLTLKTCPPTPDDWHRIRRAWEKRVSRDGMIRMHWVTEWQRRGVPHLHVSVWLPTPDPSGLLWHWVQVAGAYGALDRGQHCTPIHGAVGWFQYVSKHASRGVKHYQRNPANIPEQWKSKTGRVWGKCGHWPVDAGHKISLEPSGFFALRRIVRAWRKADARASGEPGRILAARRMLKCKERKMSELRGVSEWIDRDDQMAILYHLVGMGHEVGPAS